MNVLLTEHAIERAWQRLGWTEHALGRMVSRVLAFGIGVDEAAGALRRYLRDHQSDGALVRAYGEHVFIFYREPDVPEVSLVTVWQLPLELRSALRRAFSESVAA